MAIIPLSSTMTAAATLALFPTLTVFVAGFVVGVLRLIKADHQPQRLGVGAWALLTHCCAGAVWLVAFNVALGRPALEVLAALPVALIMAPLWPMQVLQAFGSSGSPSTEPSKATRGPAAKAS